MLLARDPEAAAALRDALAKEAHGRSALCRTASRMKGCVSASKVSRPTKKCSLDQSLRELSCRGVLTYGSPERKRLRLIDSMLNT